MQSGIRTLSTPGTRTASGVTRTAQNPADPLIPARPKPACIKGLHQVPALVQRRVLALRKTVSGFPLLLAGDEHRGEPVSSEEWAEFEEHFDKRKVELGSCARPYGTGCQHEHACIRCPMLNVNPKMIGRLDELEGDLLTRRHRAETERWMGEIEGIDLTLTFLRAKRDQAQRLSYRPLLQIQSTALPRPTP